MDDYTPTTEEVRESKLVRTGNILLGITFTVLVLIFIQTWWVN